MVEKNLDELKLNIKLLIFAFKKETDTDTISIPADVPDLVNSLDAQAIYIYPKLIQLGWEFTTRYIKPNEVSDLPFSPNYTVWLEYEPYSPVVSDDDKKFKVDAETPSKAFALALEKYIDSLDGRVQQGLND